MNSMDVSGKQVVVMGVADRDSIAWAIAERFVRAGAHVTITYQQKFLSRIRVLNKDFKDVRMVRCDVMNDQELSDFFASCESIDVLVHSIAYGPAEIFTKTPSEVSREAFAETMAVSAQSLASVIRFAKPRLSDWSSVMALTYQASQRAKPTYGMMGVAKAALESLVRYLSVELGNYKHIRVNAISPGPIPTVAALSEVIAFRRSGKHVTDASPALRAAIDRAGAETELDRLDELEYARRVWKHLQQKFLDSSAIRELVEAQDVADYALFLGSNASRKITGQVLLLDCGHSILMS